MSRMDHRALILVVVAGATALLLTPARGLWGGVGLPWWAPLLLWLGLVGLGLAGALLARPGRGE